MSITTFGLAANTLVTQGYGGVLAVAVEDALLELALSKSLENI